MNNLDDKEAFRQAVQAAVAAGHMIHLRKTFEVAESTVKRWITGVACPLPRIRQLIQDECNRLQASKNE
jgi:hypothetical protein